MSTITDTATTTAVSNDTDSALPADPHERLVMLMDIVVAAAASFEDWAEDTVRVTLYDIAVSPSRLLHAVRAAICADLDDFLTWTCTDELEVVAGYMTYLAGQLVFDSAMSVPTYRPSAQKNGHESGEPRHWDPQDYKRIPHDISRRLMRMVRCGVPETCALHGVEIHEIGTGWGSDVWTSEDVDITARVEAIVRADYERIMRTGFATGQDLHQDMYYTAFARAMLEHTPDKNWFDRSLYVDDIWNLAWTVLPVEQKHEFQSASWQCKTRQYKNDASIAVDLHDWADEAPLTTTPDMLVTWQMVDTSHIQDELNTTGHSND